MKVAVPEGKWVVAVSGGVDSVVLLDLIAQQMIKDQRSKVNVLVAHFDHGIRPESSEDATFVGQLAKEYGLAFFTERAELGAGASEAAARKARYGFLRRVQKEQGADGIITAHHEDDLLETMILNLQRGTGSKGLSSLRSTDELIRPLLSFNKSEILGYAKKHGLKWHEDATNADDSYARNRVRHNLLPKISDNEKQALLLTSKKASKLNAEIAELVCGYLSSQPSKDTLDRERFRDLPDEVKAEVLVHWLRRETNVEVSRQMIERLVAAIVAGRNNSMVDVARGYSLRIARSAVVLKEGVK